MEKIIYLEKRDLEELPPGATEDERIEAAVRWINKKVQATVHFGLVQIGYFLLNTFFNGDVEEALSKNPRKHHSFRKLCRRGDLLISATHLVNAVKLVVQERQLAGDRAFTTLPVSHKIALLGVRDVENKRAFARRAASENLSVRALTREVRQAQGLGLSPADAWARKLRRALNVVLEMTAESVPEGLSENEARYLDRSILEARKRLQTTLGSVRGIRSVAV